MSRLSDRIAWCERMAQEATIRADRYRYISEAAGLRGLQLRQLVSAHSMAVVHGPSYHRGLSDRATLLRLEDGDV